jgi:hypothetical protein
MHRPPSVVKTATAVLLSAVLVGACVTKAHGATVVHRSHEQVLAMGTSVPLPDSPANSAGNAFDSLDARMQRATADATNAGADLSIVVSDRRTGQTVANGNDTAFPIASVAKLFIADDLLLQVSKGQTQLSPADRNAFDVMLRSSDDGAAEDFWNRSGGSAIVDRVVARYGLAATRAPSNGRWFNTISTATDLVRYYDMLLAGTGGLPPEQASIILSTLAASTPTAPDGMVPGGVYPQRFGIPEGLSGEPVAVKQGWMCCVGADWMHLSTGVIGPNRRYVMAIGSMQPASAEVARETITRAVRTIFPDGRI